MSLSEKFTQVFSGFHRVSELRDFFAYTYVPHKAKELKKKLKKKKSVKREPLPTSLRIVSFNVHFHSRYLSAAGDFDEGVKAVVKELDADILILEEVVRTELVVSRDDYPYIEFHSPNTHTASSGRLGNAICSKIPLTDVKAVVYKQPKELNTYEPRGFIAVTVEPVKGRPIRVIGTHLDVWDESGKTRCEQVKQINKEAESCGLENVICLGDFNAIQRSDYTDEHWKWIVQQDKVRGISTVTNAIDIIRKELLWRDSYMESEAVNGVAQDGPHTAPCVTTWSLRRVDFALLAPSFKLPISNAIVHYNAASDHLPIGVDIKL